MILLLPLLDIMRLLALLDIVRPALAGGSILNIPSVDCALLENDLYCITVLTALNTELAALLKRFELLRALTAASVDSVVLDKLLY
jgi:hypothetical protein